MTLCAAVFAMLPQIKPVVATEKHLAPVPPPTFALMAARGTSVTAPILIRLYKKEAELEIWKQASSGRFVHLKTFPICRWSGQLGPKRRQGDRQAPEGFYSITPKQMNPNSAYYLSFNIGFPNAYDKAQGASGAFLMVHGTCSSAGCYAMTDDAIREIYAIAREAFSGGQRAFQLQAYPFRMTAANMAKYRADPNYDFWLQLKEGSDRFEASAEPPVIAVAAGRYTFRPYADSAKEMLAKVRISQEAHRVSDLIESGSAAVRTSYVDGGQHPSFRRIASLPEVSRPEAIAAAPRDLIIIPARPQPRPCQGAACTTAIAQPRPQVTFVNVRPWQLRDDIAVDLSPLTSIDVSTPLSSWSTISGAIQIVPATMLGSGRIGSGIHAVRS